MTHAQHSRVLQSTVQPQAPTDITRPALSVVGGRGLDERLDPLERDYLMLPRKAMAEVGAATQTLGAFLSVASNRSFRTVDEYAAQAHLNRRTVLRHLAQLSDNGWLLKLGRERTASGRARRTVTYQLTDKARNRGKYGRLPRWAAEILPNWSTRAIYSLVVARHQMVSRKTDDDRANIGIEEDEGLSVATLIEHSGLHKMSVLSAKSWLLSNGFIVADGIGRRGAHVLLINREFDSEQWLRSQV